MNICTPIFCNSTSIFTTVSGAIQITFNNLANGAMQVSFTDNTSNKRAIVIINPSQQALTYNLNGEWNLIADGTLASTTTIRTDSGSITVDPISIRVYVNY